MTKMGTQKETLAQRDVPPPQSTLTIGETSTQKEMLMPMDTPATT